MARQRRRIWPFSKRPPRAGIFGAASTIVTGGNPANPDAIVARQEAWQKRVNQLIGVVPEANAAAKYVRNSLGRVKFTTPGIVDPVVRRIIERQLESFDAGRISENVFRVGEGVIAYEYDAAQRRTRWWDYSIFEYESDGKKPAAVIKPDGKKSALPPARKSFRVWQPDPDNRWAAYSSNRAAIDVLEAMYVHQLADTTVATSRLAGAGVLYWPNDDLQDVPADNGSPEQGSQQDVARQLAIAMTSTVKNRDAADAIVPFIYFGSAAAAAGLRHVLTERPDNAYAYVSRMDGYAARYARGVDLPAEVVLGLSEANHWTAWKVDENTWTYYLAPLADLIADALLRNFVEPVARALGYQGAVDCEPDGSDVIAKPDKTDAGIKLQAQGVITKVAAAEAAGFKASDVDPDGVPINQAPPEAGGLPVDATGQAPLGAAAKGSAVRRLKRLSAELMKLEAQTYDQYQTMLLTRVTAYLKALAREQAGLRAAANPRDELELLASTANAITRKALEQRISILARTYGADREALALRYTAIIDRRSQAVSQAATSYATHLSQTASIAQQLEQGAPLNRFEAIRLNPAVVSGLTSVMNGGTAQYSDDFTRLASRPADFGSDEIVKQTTIDAGDEYVTQYEWTRGDPANPFEPHVELDGETWTDFAAATFLDNAHLGLNPAGVWFPGDHVGCQCEYEITLIPLSEAI